MCQFRLESSCRLSCRLSSCWLSSCCRSACRLSVTLYVIMSPVGEMRTLANNGITMTEHFWVFYVVSFVQNLGGNSVTPSEVRGVLGNKCAGQHNLKMVHFRETLASGNFLAWSSAIHVFFCSPPSTLGRQRLAFM
jgi:hypothetical protein